ncbi:MAG: hypothetical protein ABSF64_28640 [Bryobacteraceae bacterium]|jgi:hypothetical protein
MKSVQIGDKIVPLAAITYIQVNPAGDYTVYAHGQRVGNLSGPVAQALVEAITGNPSPVP